MTTLEAKYSNYLKNSNDSAFSFQAVVRYQRNINDTPTC